MPGLARRFDLRMVSDSSTGGGSKKAGAWQVADLLPAAKKGVQADNKVRYRDGRVRILLGAGWLHQLCTMACRALKALERHAVVLHACWPARLQGAKCWPGEDSPQLPQRHVRAPSPRGAMNQQRRKSSVLIQSVITAVSVARRVLPMAAPNELWHALHALS